MPTTVTQEFEFNVGDHVCMQLAKEEDFPPKMQVIALFCSRDFEGDHSCYHVRSSSVYKTEAIQVAGDEIMAYPSTEFLEERLKEREVRRIEISERMRQMREYRRAAVVAETKPEQA